MSTITRHDTGTTDEVYLVAELLDILDVTTVADITETVEWNDDEAMAEILVLLNDPRCYTTDTPITREVLEAAVNNADHSIVNEHSAEVRIKRMEDHNKFWVNG